jgi:hypothetical protein
MRVQVLSIQVIAEGRHRVEFQLDGDSIVAHVSEMTGIDVPCFNFDEVFFDVLLAFNGLGARFNRDYWRFRQGEHLPFPWDYGDHGREILDRAVLESRTEIGMLRDSVE